MGGNMRLRNKKTGEIETLSIFGISVNIRKENQPYYRTIKELCEEWEDYTPAEPLIKDEKIRRAVRAWADANFAYELLVDNNYGFSDYNGKSITFVEASSSHLSAGKTYTIAELCGEEEK